MDTHAPRCPTTTVLDEIELLLAEEDLFEHHGNLFYKHESGAIFTAPIYDIAHNAVNVVFADSIPTGAIPYELLHDTERERRTDAWTNACDLAIAKTPFA